MQPENQIPHDLREKVDRELDSGEHVTWLQMPVPRYFTPGSTAACLFGIPWTGFAIFWTTGAAWGSSKVENAGFFRAFPLFGVPFILIGFGMLLSPVWAYRKALRTVYVVTNRRAITFDGLRTTTVRSYPPERLKDVYRKERKDGTGDVIIARRAWRDSEGTSQSEELGFLRIRDPKTVEAMLRKLAQNASEAV